MSGILKVDGLRKRYGDVEAVQRFTHTFSPGRITTLVGPSGSGKSTVLWMMAGLIAPDEGRVSLDDDDITALAPERRNIGMVFQDYALFPHLSVRENVEFGLRVRGIAAAERRRRALETLELVRISRLADRRTTQISGGEQQRVALARALAIRPRVLLLDEPLSALDAKLRERLRAELFRIFQDLAITTVYVTHDQIEAMSLGHELIVMNQGRVEQAGRPIDVYRKPTNPFVADFLGSANIFEGEVFREENGSRIRLPFGTVDLPDDLPTGTCFVMIRPEDMELAHAANAHFHATLESSLFLGHQRRLILNAEGHQLIVDVGNEAALDERAPLSLSIRPGKVFVWPKDG